MRATLDKLISWTGLILAVVLVVAGGLLTWANVFIGDQVEEQFSAQDITMPTQEAIDAQVESGAISEEDAEALEPFAGEPLDNGPAARAYSDHYILAHMNGGSYELAETVGEMGVDTSSWELPLTYSSAGAVAGAIEADESLSPEVKEEATAAVNTFRSESLFKGNTLRGLLLYGYAFATVGTIAGIAAIAAFVAAAVLLLLALMGLRHARQTDVPTA
jgi:cytoskeletal protein RodZ